MGKTEAGNNRLFENQLFTLSDYANLYKKELLENVLPFWLRFSKDEKHGGYYTALSREGCVYDGDKFMWLQGREVWCFSYMYNHVEQKPEWLELARHGAAFMLANGRDAAGNWYFSLTAEGKPLVQPYNIFSDCFAAMGFASLDKADPGKGYGKIAIDTFKNILERKDDWKGIYNKNYPGTRSLKSFSLPMILCNLSLEMEHLLGEEKVNELVPQVIHEVMDCFYRPELGIILENIQENGELSESFEGRLVNPGHGIEAMWFIMDLGNRFNNRALIEKAVEITLSILEYGWDTEYGGIFYFLDRKGYPPLQLEWDQKLWWVHVEALVALSKGFAFTEDPRCMQWFEKVHNYTWKHFRDPVYGEWFGYLNRRGEVLLNLKGGKWKGAFHVPRALYQVWNTFKSLDKTST